MSRIGYKPVTIPQGVKITVGTDVLTVEGPKGKLTQTFNPAVSFKIEGNVVNVGRDNDSKISKSFHGLYRNLLNNMVIGVSEGFKRVLLINGVGYRAELKGTELILNLGYSTDFIVMIPKNLTVSLETNQKVIISGIDKQSVGQFASEVRSLRTPEPYKGKGIRYEDEHIRRKVGKSGVK